MDLPTTTKLKLRYYWPCVSSAWLSKIKIKRDLIFLGNGKYFIFLQISSSKLLFYSLILFPTNSPVSVCGALFKITGCISLSVSDLTLIYLCPMTKSCLRLIKSPLFPFFAFNFVASYTHTHTLQFIKMTH